MSLISKCFNLLFRPYKDLRNLNRRGKEETASKSPAHKVSVEKSKEKSKNTNDSEKVVKPSLIEIPRSGKILWRKK